MGTITPVVTEPFGMAGVKLATWTLGDADTGLPVGFPDYIPESVEITGTIASATVVVAGSNDGTTYVTLTDPQGNGISKTTGLPVIEAIEEKTLYTRAATSGGSGTTVVVSLLLVQRR